MEKIEDGLACRIFDNTMTEWYGFNNPVIPKWDDITEEQREIYRDAARRRIVLQQKT
jgi:hypothetical protein